MKNINKFLLFLFVFSIFVSCEDEDKNPVPLDEIESAAVLRTVEVINLEVNLKDIAGSTIAVEVEADDFANSSRFESVDVYVSYVDNFVDEDNETPTPNDDEDISKPDVFVRNVAASEFTTGPNGKPTAVISLNAQDAIDLLDLQSEFDSEQADGGDIFRLRLALNLNSGEVYTSTNIGNNISGVFFNSPFRYDAKTLCVLPEPPTGQWNINMQDTFGDGWNGAKLVADLDGIETEFLVTEAEGFSSSATLTVPDGSQELTFTFESGDFDNEITFQIFAPSGNLVADEGPSPTAGVVILNLCSE